MSWRILSITVLLLSVCSLSSQAPSANWRHLPKRSRPPCCVVVSAADISDVVTGNTYHEQAGPFPCVKAIIFNTQHGQVCVHPKAQWAKELTVNMTKQ